MKKGITILVIAIIVVVGGIALAMYYNNSSNKYKSSSTNTKTSSSTNNMPMQQSSSTSTNPAQATSTNAVTISNFAFSPAAIAVSKGTTVTWTNQDSTAHTVQETDGQAGPNSSPLDQGKSYSFTFNTVGTFKYHCSIHPDMTGTVTVTN